MSDEIRGNEPGLTTKQMIVEIYGWAIAEQKAELPKRVSDMEKWQNRVIGGIAVLMGLNLLDRVAAFLAPPIEAAMAAIINVR